MRVVGVRAFLAATVAAFSLWGSPANVNAPLPVAFEENRGQDRSKARFLLRLPGAQVRVHDTSLDFTLRDGSVVRWELLGTTGKSAWTALDAPGGATSYYLGNDSSKWVRGARTHRRLELRDVYPGIDWVAYITQDTVEYDLILRPGADASHVRLRVSGATAQLRPDGSIVAASAGGEVRQTPPFTYQIVNGEKTPARSTFTDVGDGVYGLVIGDYDPELPIYIDPLIHVPLVVAGNGDDRIVGTYGTSAVAVTRSADWNRPPGGGGSDIMVRCGGPAESVVFFWGGSGDDEAAAVVLDQTNQCRGTVVGWTSSRDLPVRMGWYEPAQPTYGGGESDGFVLTLGYQSPEFATYVGGDGADRLVSIARRAVSYYDTQFVYGGSTNSVTWPGLRFIRQGTGGLDALVVTGETAFAFGGSGDDRANSAAILADGSIGVAGETSSNDFPLSGALQYHRGGATDAFVARIRPDPIGLESATLWGGSGDDRATALLVAPGGAVYIAGTTTSSDFPIVNAWQSAFGGDSDAFFVRFDALISKAIVSTYLGGSGAEHVLAAALRQNDPVLVGTTTSAAFPRAGTPVQEALGGKSDGFVAHLDPYGRPLWTTLIGGPDDDAINSVAASPSGATVVTGTTRSRVWLDSLTPETRFAGSGAPGGLDAFAANLSYPVITGSEASVGKDLQTLVFLHLPDDSDADGVFAVTSADPSRLLVSASQWTIGAASVTIGAPPSRSTEPRTATVYVQALDSSGSVDLIVAGRGYAERRVAIHLAPSVLVVTPKELSTESGGSVSVTVSVARANPDTGAPLQAQRVRPGLDAAINVVSSQESGLRFASSSQSSDGFSTSFTFKSFAEGTYTLTPQSPFFATPDDQRAWVSAGPGDGIASRIYLARDASASLQVPGSSGMSFTVTSEDPTKVRVASSSDLEPSSGFWTSAGGGWFTVTALDDTGIVGIRIVGSDGSMVRHLVALGPLDLKFGPEKATAVIYSTVYPSIEARPAGSAPRGFTVPSQSLRRLYMQTLQAADPSMLQFRPAGAYQSASFYAASVGTTAIEITPPAHANVNVSRMEVVIIPGDINVGDRIVVPEGYASMIYPVIANVAQQLRDQVQFTIADGAIAKFWNGTTSMYLMGPSYGLDIYADGVSGQSTSLTISGAGVQTKVIPIVISKAVLVPVSEHIHVGPSGARVYFEPLVLDPATGLPTPNTFRTSRRGGASAPIAVSVAATNNDCRFGSQLSSERQLEVACTGTGSVSALVQPNSSEFGTTPAWAALHISYSSTGPSAPSIAATNGFPQWAYAGKGVHVGLSLPGLARESAVTLTSESPELLRISASMNQTGSDRIAFQPYTSQRTVYLQGLANEGVASILVEAPGYVPARIRVRLLQPSLAIRYEYSGGDGTSIQIPVSNESLSLRVSPMLTDPAGGGLFAPPNISMAPDAAPFLARITSSNDNALESQSPTPLLDRSSTGAVARFRPRAQGVADLTVQQPDGFASSPESGLRVTVTQLSLRFSQRPAVGKDLQVDVSIAASNGSSLPYGTPIKVTSLNPSVLLVSAERNTVGAASAITSGYNTVYLQSLGVGGAVKLRLEAQGYAPAEVEADLYHSAIVWGPSYNISTQAGSENEMSFELVPVQNGMRVYGSSNSPRPGFAIPIRLISADPSIVQILDSSNAQLSASNQSVRHRWKALRPGTVELRVESDPGVLFLQDRRTATVTPWSAGITTSPYSAVRYLRTTVQLTNPRQQPTTFTAASVGATEVRLATSLTGAGSAQLALTVPAKSAVTLYAEPVGAGNSGKVKISAPDFVTGNAFFYPADPMFHFGATGATADFTLASGTASLKVIAGSQSNTGSNQGVPLGVSLGTLQVGIESSNPNVVKPVSGSITFKPGDASNTIQLQLVGKGQATLSLVAPQGFNLPTGRRDLIVNVR